MARAYGLLTLAALLLAAQAEQAAEAPAALAADDECGADGGQCALNALQVKGVAAVGAAQGSSDEAFAFEDAEVFDEGEDSAEGYNCVVGYHQTSPHSGASIMRSGFDVHHAVGSGIAGKGIYFATSFKATKNKAHHHGFCIKAQVCLGHSKKLQRWPRGCCSYHQLQHMGYDSATIERGGFYYREYVVYRNDQMKVLAASAAEPAPSRTHARARARAR
eukprot:CAMPEP_0204528846 /NCGR_PEP_ID=MMETSP0661-20131031/9747_1 /ASSEMBLY_ACC=CAM_ASM_000606 /TAXON_ID=109239 /ORGANISM="Alexandrium margalefi, Strain AMGDE01CS-322" /LENGTH=218 /DNA_ID=CAMNT_0051534843 /DNA_START=57 /DNA_END=711 /DNA_ORIENTATION=+